MSTAVSIEELFADDPRVTDVARMRSSEWGHEAGSTHLADWIATTKRECRTTPSRRGIPFTLVAIDAEPHIAGAVGLSPHDPEGLPDRTPWVVGTVVRPELRGFGVGRALMTHLEDLAADFEEIWVATRNAKAFYRRCGYTSLPSTDSILYLRRRRNG